MNTMTLNLLGNELVTTLGQLSIELAALSALVRNQV